MHTNDLYTNFTKNTIEQNPNSESSPSAYHNKVITHLQKRKEELKKEKKKLKKRYKKERKKRKYNSELLEDLKEEYHYQNKQYKDSIKDLQLEMNLYKVDLRNQELEMKHKKELYYVLGHVHAQKKVQDFQNDIITMLYAESLPGMVKKYQKVFTPVAIEDGKCSLTTSSIYGDDPLALESKDY